MVSSRANYNIHIIFWGLLALYPSALIITGSAALSQRVMHVFFIIFIASLVVLFKKQPQVERKLLECFLMYVFLTLAYYGIITLAHSAELQGVGLMDLSRPIVYFSYFMFPLFFPLAEDQFKDFLKFFFILCMAQIVFSSFVYFKSLWPLVNLYKGRTSDDVFLFQFFRWSGTFGYPSDFSFFLSFFIYFTFLSLRHRLYNNWKVATGLCMITVALVMALSRGGMATVAVMMALAAYMYKHMKGLAFLILIMGTSMLIVYSAINMIGNEMFNISYVLELLEEGTKAHSATHRVMELKLAWNIMLENFPFGNGPDRLAIQEVLPVVETMYGHYLIKWGVIGWLLYMVSVFYLAHVAYGLWKGHDDKFIATFSGAMFILILSVPLVFGFSSAITDRYKVLPFYYVLTGYLVMLNSGAGKKDAVSNDDLKGDA